jgi:hypothetical protein
MGKLMPQAMKSWWFSLALLVGYVMTFLLWKTFSNRTAFLLCGLLAMLVMAAGMKRAARGNYFVNRTDLVLHGLVIVDVALEGLSFEVFNTASRCILCAPGDASTFHNSYNFCWCTAILGGLVAGYHWWALRQVRRSNEGAPSPPGQAATV